ncbi:arginine deiminase [Solibacillus sp. CAU 1738]|uniref:arginine deiminase n=1 Tax=Solibacillus sp. CAU 1738 TaxID=3140363 RepID=UPI003260F2AE
MVLRVNVRNEIMPLKKVLLHRPGQEVENLTPEYLERLLFDDIPWLEQAQKEHDAFADILRENGVEVVYLDELAAEAINDPKVKEEFINQFIKEAGVNCPKTAQQVHDYLNAFKDNKELIQKTMAGIRREEIPASDQVNLASLVDQSYPFITDPMPNLYFTRDPFATVGDKISLNRMYSVTRNRETIYADYIFKYHPEYKGTQKVFDRDFVASIEGGDILNLSAEVVAVGISQRTTPEAIEEFAKQLFFKTEGNLVNTVLAIDIPKTRAYMHLDTVFTQVDYDKFTIHPGIQGPLQVFAITKGEGEELKIEKLNMELDKILSTYLKLDSVTLIPCGRGDAIAAEREQWNDGSNTLCIKPGHVVVYSRNYVTNELLEQHGITLHIIPSSELSRGRGGPRCMSMPLLREE